MTRAILPLLAIGLAGVALSAAARAPAPAPAAAAASGAPFQLAWPLACQPASDCWVQNYFDDDPGPGARDHACGSMTYDGHDGTDIRLPSLAAMRRGVAVLAAGPGLVKATRDGVTDISIRDPANPHIQGQDCGNAVVVVNPGGWQTVYCHMRKGSVRVKSGDQIRTGQPLGLVGLSGDTEFPHLHIGVRRGAAKIDPFAPDTPPGTCGGSGPGLWSPAVASRLAYRSPSVINAGFAGGPAPAQQVDDETLPRPGRTAPLVAYVRTIGLKAGDVQKLSVSGPGGPLAATQTPPLDRAKAVWLSFVGKKAPATGWPTGAYRADYSVTRNGKVVLSRTWTNRL